MDISYNAKISLYENGSYLSSFSSFDAVKTYLDDYAEEHHLTPEDMNAKNFTMVGDKTLHFS